MICQRRYMRATVSEARTRRGRWATDQHRSPNAVGPSESLMFLEAVEVDEQSTANISLAGGLAMTRRY